MTITHQCSRCGCDVECDVDLGRPPPPCSNPNRAAFSDYGDPPEYLGPDNCPECGEKITSDEAAAVVETALINA